MTQIWPSFRVMTQFWTSYWVNNMTNLLDPVTGSKLLTLSEHMTHVWPSFRVMAQFWPSNWVIIWPRNWVKKISYCRLGQQPGSKGSNLGLTQFDPVWPSFDPATGSLWWYGPKQAEDWPAKEKTHKLTDRHKWETPENIFIKHLNYT